MLTHEQNANRNNILGRCSLGNYSFERAFYLKAAFMEPVNIVFPSSRLVNSVHLAGSKA